VDISAINRSAIWADTWSVFRASPIVGSGFGAFQTVYPLHGRSDGSQIVAQSHNDYLQVLADCGVVGAAIALVFIALLFRATFRGARSSDPLIAAVAAGCGAGIVAILVHSLFDFNLQLPSNALLFLILCAVVSGACTLASERSSTRRRRAPRMRAASA
jgi:O-antigen ligase